MATRRPFRLLLDWDGTLTKKDTISPLVKIGYQVNERKGTPVPTPWNQIVDEYLADLADHDARYTPERKDRKTVEEESTYLASLEPVELASIRRVEAAGVFKNVTAGDLLEGARKVLNSGKVELRAHWEKLWELSCGPPTIISVNWSSVFIRSCLTIATEVKENSIDAQTIQETQIIANDIAGTTPEHQSLSNGSLTTHRLIHTSAHKARELSLATQNFSPDTISVYVGDSDTDLDALLAADIGIVIRNTRNPPSLADNGITRTLLRVGVRMEELSGVDVLGEWERKGKGKGERAVYWTDSLGDIARALA